mmetsp:Transcript_9979/g.19746  ORF Transcript_9979/g.19746 Transcript_9979/m.19746 type:complete len:351 (+) Transcript_9979:26-1078(+)
MELVNRKAIPRVAADVIKAKFAKLSRIRDTNGELAGPEISLLLNFDLLEVPNLYTINLRNKVFNFHYSEHEHVARASGKLTHDDPIFSAHFFPTPYVEAGINYLGQIEIRHSTGEMLKIHVPGERTYDPAGVTGSQVSSERIDGPYFCFMMGVIVSQIRAAQYGASQRFLEEVCRVTKPLLEDYYQRYMLHDWMTLQVTQTCCLKRKSPAYGEFLKNKIFEKALKLQGDRNDHTKEYIEQFLACEEGTALMIYPPRQYFKKVCQEDESELQNELEANDLSKVRQVAGQYFSEIVLKLFPKLTPGASDANLSTTAELLRRCDQLTQRLEKYMSEFAGEPVVLSQSLPMLFK